MAENGDIALQFFDVAASWQRRDHDIFPPSSSWHFRHLSLTFTLSRIIEPTSEVHSTPPKPCFKHLKTKWSHERSRVGRSIYHIHIAVDISGSFLRLNVIRSLSSRWDQRVSCLVACCETSIRTILGNSVLLLLKADS